MRRSTGLLIICVIVVVAVAAAILLRTRGSSAPAEPDRPEPVRFHHTDVAVASPDLDVGPADVRGAYGPGHTSWRVETICEEPEGCNGSFRVEVRFDSGSGEKRITIGSYVDVPSGGPMRFEGLQNPSTAVLAIKRVSLEVHSRGTPGQKPEIPW